MSRTGRRPGPTQTREEILAAARRAFAEQGYDAVSVRAVARAAGVDPALVHRFFGGKESLFAAALALPFEPHLVAERVLDGPRGAIGERAVGTLLGILDSGDRAQPLLALLRSAVTHEAAAAMLREFLTAEVLGRIATAAAPDRPELRAALAGSQMLGLLLARYVIRLPAIENADREELAAAVGGTIQRYLTRRLG